MKIISLILIVMLQITEVFGQSCRTNVIDQKIDEAVNLADQATCVATKANYQCDKLKDDLEGDEKKRVIECDAKSLEENSLSNTSIKSCVWNGIVMSFDSFKDMGQSIAKSIVSNFQCDTSIEKKRELLNAFNLTVSEERFKISERFTGDWLNSASCGQIQQLLSSRYQNAQDVLARERIAAITTGKKAKPVGDESNQSGLKTGGTDFGKMVKETINFALDEAGTRYQCYTPKFKAEMICTAVTSLLIDAAVGAGALGAVKKVIAIIKSKRALKAIKKAVDAGEEIDLKDAAKLLKGDRLKAAAKVLGKDIKDFTKEEKDAILKAHEIGLKEKRGFYEYTQEDIVKKARILREAGFDPAQTRALMEAGITGAFRDNAFFRNAMLDYMQKALKVASWANAAQSEALIAIHELGFNTAKNFMEKATEILKNAGFSDKQIETILKAKGNQEKGLITSTSVKEEEVAAALAKKKAEEAAIIKAAAEEKAKAKAEAEARVLAQAKPTPAASATQKLSAVAAKIQEKIVSLKKDFANDVITNYKIPAEITSTVKKEAQKFLDNLLQGKDVTTNMQEDGIVYYRERRLAEEARERLASPRTANEAQEAQAELERATLERDFYQARCKKLAELYFLAYGESQQNYFNGHCK
jgi:tryptophan 2,3-dioxygenase